MRSSISMRLRVAVNWIYLVFVNFAPRNPAALAMRKRVYELITNGIENGEVQPLKAHVFDRDHVEDAFRFMASGKHIGKVMIKVKDEEPKEMDRKIDKHVVINAIRSVE